MTVRNRSENKLDARLNKSKHVKARNRTNDVDRLNDPHMRTRKTNVFNIIPTTTIVYVNVANVFDDKWRNLSKRSQNRVSLLRKSIFADISMNTFGSNMFIVEFSGTSQTARLAFFDFIQHPACHWGLRTNNGAIDDDDEFESSIKKRICRFDAVNCVGVDAAAGDIVNGRSRRKKNTKRR